ncbi:MAG TPA: hypothetical protein VMI32_05150 [Candidatus Solibacter sp.]|nr:hypothetical protein [Candidatus Solibacter sp.]
MHVILRSVELSLNTRRQRQIKNLLDWLPMHYGAALQVKDLQKKYSRGVHRPVDASRKYNCHGLTFASRRTRIEEAAEIKKIIEDDEYVEINRNEALPGDVVVYYVDGDPEHSGIVVSMEPLAGPLVLSKWGFCQEVVHRIPECPYDARHVVFYRVVS